MGGPEARKGAYAHATGPKPSLPTSVNKLRADHSSQEILINKFIKVIVLSLVLALLPAIIYGNTLVVKDVQAGGIIVFEKNNFTARLTGLDVPGMDHRLGLEIWDFAKRAVHGKKVKVFTWTTDSTASGIVHDDDGYPFVQIQYGKNWSHDLNEILLEKGYARVDEDYLPDFLQRYKEIEIEAQENKVGIWMK